MFMSRGKAGKIALVNKDDEVIAKQKQKQKNSKKFKGHGPYLVVLGIIAATLLTAALSFKLLLSLDKEFMPKLDQRQFMIKATMPAGTNLKATDAVVRRIEDAVLRFAPVRDVTVNIGSSKASKKTGAVEVLGANEANIIVNLHPRPSRGLMSLFKERDEGAEKNDIATSVLVQQIKTALSEIDLQEAKIEYMLQESVFKSVFAGSAPLVIVLRGFDLENIMLPAAQEIEKQLAKIEGVYGIKDSLTPPSPEVKIHIRKDRASLYQLNVNKVSAVAQAGIRGYVATKFKEEGREIDVRVRLREEDRGDFQKIGKLLVFSPLGVHIFLDQLAYLAKGKGPTEIKRESKQRVVFVSANIYNRGLNDIVDEAKVIISNIRDELPQNYSIEIGGENQEMEESFKSLQFALILALLLVYMIMASEFESLIQPFIIMFTVPLSLIGVSWTLFLTKTPLSVVVALGFIMLGGIVVNNGILLIDFMNLARKQGLGIFEAAIQSSRVRARPILMTSLTTIFGLMPLAFALGEGSELRAPMARTVMGGLTSAAFLTLFIVPCVYIILESLKEWVMTFFQPEKQDEENRVLVRPKQTIIEEIDVSHLMNRKKSDADWKQGAEEEYQDTEDIQANAEQLKEKARKELNPRQFQALDFIRQTGKITRLEYVVKFKVPLPIADRELEQMEKINLIKSTGEGPSKVYFAAEEKAD